MPLVLQNWEVSMQVLLLSRGSDLTSLALIQSKAKAGLTTRKEFGG